MKKDVQEAFIFLRVDMARIEGLIQKICPHGDLRPSHCLVRYNDADVRQFVFICEACSCRVVKRFSDIPRDMQLALLMTKHIPPQWDEFITPEELVK